MQTYLVYIPTFLIIIFASYLAQKKNKRRYIVFAAVVLAVVAGLRAESVGVDTANYVKLFGHIAQGRLELAYGLEESFKYICAFLLQIWNNNNFLLFVFALITSAFVFLRLWDFKDRISLTWATAVYFAVLYFLSFNIMRQLVAVAIVFFATRYLERKKYFSFLLLVAIASLFHKSALIGVVFIGLEIFAWAYLNRKQRNWIGMLLFISPVLVVILGYVLITRYYQYFANIKLDFGALLIVKLLIWMLTAPTLRKEIMRSNENQNNSSVAYSFATCKIYYLFGILLTSLGYMIQYMDRVGLYFYVFEAVYIGWTMKSKSVNILVKIAIALLYAMLLVLTIFGNAQGQGNYLFFWQLESALK